MLDFLKKKDKKYYLKQSLQIAKEEANWKIEKSNLERRNKIDGERKELVNSSPHKMSMSKKMLIFLFCNCTVIEIFTGYVTYTSLKLALEMGLAPDFTPLVTLIGAVVGEVIGLAAYFLKSVKENSEGGIVYQSMMNNSNNNVG